MRTISKLSGSLVWSITSIDQPSLARQRVRYGLPPTRTRSVSFEREQGVHVDAERADALRSAEVRQIDHEARLVDVPSCGADQLDAGFCGAARRDEVVHQEHALLR